MSSWRELSVVADAARAEILSDAFDAHGALSVSVEDADAGTDRELPQFGEPGSPAQPLWPRSRVVALFAPGTDLAAILAACLAAAGLPGDTAASVGEVAERDWVRLSQAEFAPIRVNQRLWIVPSWHDLPDPGAVNIRLDPGMAFGTGSHATTRLCLDWLCATVTAGHSVLDYGCGSGILAIAAAMLGARPVVGVDIDTQALAAARDNAERNGVAIEILHSREPMDLRFDRVVANILTNPLKGLAPLLTGRVRRGGRLVLSGILAEQAEDVMAVYRPAFDFDPPVSDEGWVRLCGTRR